MKANKVLLAVLAALCALMIFPDNAFAQDKKSKKKKKEFKWEWDGKKSGNKAVDDYLVACDSLWTKIQLYQEDIASYKYMEDTIPINGVPYIVVSMEDSLKNKLTTGMANWQMAESLLTGFSIVANGVQIGAQTVSATAALPSLGLGALSYAKYVTAGPQIIGLASKEIKDIVNMRKSQMKKWKAIKENAIDPSTLNLGLDEAALKKFQKCYFIQKMEQEDPMYTTVTEIYSKKTEDELKAESGSYVQNEISKTTLPEDAEKMKENEDLDSKYLEEAIA